MKKIIYLTITTTVVFFNALYAQEVSHESHEENLKRNKIGLYLGNSVIHEVHNNKTGKEQYVLAPTFGLDYEYALTHRFALGLYNEISF
ncbi:MAG: hypothetical protein HC819_00415 [Cyclobacteriaceae bacterium]|nr:hypothetical protein [Cyclobacteriaceae bacterium]